MAVFEKYKRMTEPEKYQRAENWQIAIGLQQVDGLSPSKYLIELAKSNIEGNLTIDEVKNAIKSYYQTKPNVDETGEEQADKVSAHIADILAESAFLFSPVQYISIHKRLFDGVFPHAGKLRTFNITKSEWVLNGDTVQYASATELKNTLEYDFEKERKFNFKGLTKKQVAEHIAEFTTSIWQIHPFEEGNTRTTAVFVIKYLRTLGFRDVSNNLFAENSWYFRNALVRAAYSNVAEGNYPDRIFLDNFFGNLLLGEKHTLKNRLLHIYATKNATVNSQNATVKLENATVKLTPTQIAVLESLSGNGKLTAQDLAQDLGKDLSTIKRALKVLKEKSLLTRIGTDKSGWWKVEK